MEAKISWFAIVPHILLLYVFIGFFTLPKTILTILTTKLNVDDKLVHGKIGILKKETLDSPISKITSVKVNQSLFGRIFKYGTVYINTASGQFEFDYVSKPDNIKKFILDKMQ